MPRMPEATRVLDRRTGEVFQERIFGGRTLQLLYGNPRGRLLTDRVLTGALAHRIYGWWQRRPSSKRRIPGFVASLGVDTSEVELPIDSYASLDEFFARRLRTGARPVDRDPDTLVSPADARVSVLPHLTGRTLRVKGCDVTLDQLLGDHGLAETYRDGAALVARLAPVDYHRVHVPEDGVASVARLLPGRLHSVHPIALAAGAPSFQNRRMVTSLESAGFGTLAVIEVGALCVGTIVQTFSPGQVTRGQEKGIFRFGGSTVIVLLEPGRARFDADLTEASARGLETLVRMGTRVARAGRGS
jgi:phosphatidylserine decarboxylase